MIHLDTSFLIQSLNKDSDADSRMRQWLKDGETFAMSTIAWTEFSCGPVNDEILGLAKDLIGTFVPFDESHARQAAWFYNESGRRRGSLIDCMIAATAQADDAPVATLNHRDFARLELLGLRLA